MASSARKYHGSGPIFSYREPAAERTRRSPEPRSCNPFQRLETDENVSALNISNFIWGIADDVLRDVYVRGKYRDVILPMTVIRDSMQSSNLPSN